MLETESLRTALAHLNQAAKKVLFLTDAAGHLTAALTDGDVRRHLLSGGTLEDSAANAGNHRPITATGREEAIRLLAQHGCIAVPVLDGAGRIMDIVLEDERQAEPHAALGLPVVIMAGGKGTRLEPYTKILPKPLIPVGDLPIMEHIMRQFRQYGCTEFHGIVNYKKQLIKAYFSENEEHFDTIWYDEDKPLGTGGGLSSVLILFGLYYVGKWLLSRWCCNFSPDNNLCQKKKKFVGHRELSLSQILALGCALSMNNIGIGFSASITGLPFLPASVSTFFCSFGFLAFGSRLGRSAFLQQIGEYTDPVSGLLLILLGLCQLYH